MKLPARREILEYAGPPALSIDSRTLRGMRVAATGFLCIVSLALASCSRDRLPAIKDPVELRRVCATLYEQFPVNESRLTNDLRYRSIYERGFPISIIPKEKWPPSIVELKPALVDKSKFGVDIHIVHIRGKGQKGYFLPVNTNSLPASADFGQGPFYLTPSRYPGVWEFLQPDVVL